MDLIIDLFYLFRYPLALLALIALAYIIVRVGSIAHFRSKAEYDRSQRGLLNGETNGKEQ